MVLKTFFGVYLPHLQNVVGDMLLNKMVDNHQPWVSCVQHHTSVVHKYRSRFVDLDSHWYKLISNHNRLLGSLLQRCELITKCLGLHFVMVFWWLCSGCWYHHLKQPSDRYSSELFISVVGSYKHMDYQLAKKRFRKLLINILIKVCILISKIIFCLNFLILNINGHQLWNNYITSFWFLLWVTKYVSVKINIVYPRWGQ